MVVWLRPEYILAFVTSLYFCSQLGMYHLIIHISKICSSGPYVSLTYRGSIYEGYNKKPWSSEKDKYEFKQPTSYHILCTEIFHLKPFLHKLTLLHFQCHQRNTYIHSGRKTNNIRCDTSKSNTLHNKWSYEEYPATVEVYYNFIFPNVCHLRYCSRVEPGGSTIFWIRTLWTDLWVAR